MLHANRNANVVGRVNAICFLIKFIIESRDSCFAHDGRAWKVDGRAQALVGPGLATPLAALFIEHPFFNCKIISVIKIQHVLHLMAAVILCHGKYW